MSVGFRVWTVDEQDRLHRMSVRRFDRLMRGEPDEICPEHAGRRVRYALVFVENENRKPVSIQRIEYGILAFDKNGRLDNDEQQREMRLAMESTTDFLPPLEPRDEQVVDASAKFARKRMKHEFGWEPTAELENAIIESIFKPGN